MGCNRNYSRGNSGCGSVSPSQDEVIVNPVRRVTNTNTNYRTVRNIHPTEVQNVNRTVIRNENYYPVYNNNVNETVVQNYDCGSDLNSNNCRRVGSGNNGNNGNNWNNGNGNNGCSNRGNHNNGRGHRNCRWF